MFHAAWLAQNKQPFSKQAAIAKLYCSELAMRTTIKAIQIHGGYGYTKDYPVSDTSRCEDLRVVRQIRIHGWSLRALLKISRIDVSEIAKGLRLPLGFNSHEYLIFARPTPPTSSWRHDLPNGVIVRGGAPAISRRMTVATTADAIPHPLYSEFLIAAFCDRGHGPLRRGRIFHLQLALRCAGKRPSRAFPKPTRRRRQASVRPQTAREGDHPDPKRMDDSFSTSHEAREWKPTN